MDLDEGMMSVEHAAAWLDVSVRTVWNIMARGELTYTMIGGSRRIPRAALRELAGQNLTPARAKL